MGLRALIEAATVALHSAIFSVISSALSCAHLAIGEDELPTLHRKVAALENRRGEHNHLAVLEESCAEIPPRSAADLAPGPHAEIAPRSLTCPRARALLSNEVGAVAAIERDRRELRGRSREIAGGDRGRSREEIAGDRGRSPAR